MVIPVCAWSCAEAMIKLVRPLGLSSGPSAGSVRFAVHAREYISDLVPAGANVLMTAVVLGRLQARLLTVRSVSMVS
jgi:hypothetical protein